MVDRRVVALPSRRTYVMVLPLTSGEYCKHVGDRTAAARAQRGPSCNRRCACAGEPGARLTTAFMVRFPPSSALRRPGVPQLEDSCRLGLNFPLFPTSRAVGDPIQFRGGAGARRPERGGMGSPEGRALWLPDGAGRGAGREAAWRCNREGVSQPLVVII
jgi:hypothetical protein